ncbi:unnamed protein product [Paramecium octaurelia]|uniref:Uncharacterized protein n=1 Tax=Paramecium octaurelia TaxID=43137 RepID=A0A8S1W845_PAROT|nr:unnamed protein product [Paramecium octaurelia]
MLQQQDNSNFSYQVLSSQSTKIYGVQLAFICEESNLFGYTELETIWIEEFNIKFMDQKNKQYTFLSYKLEGHSNQIYVLEYNSKLKLIVSANLDEMLLWQKDIDKQWKCKQMLKVSIFKRLLVISDKQNQIIFCQNRIIDVFENQEKQNICYSQTQSISNQYCQMESLKLNEQQDLLFVYNYNFEILILKVHQQKWQKLQRLTNIKDSIFVGVKYLFYIDHVPKDLNYIYQIFALNTNNQQFERINQVKIQELELNEDESSFFIPNQTIKCCKVYHSSSRGAISYRSTMSGFQRVMAISQKGLFIVRLDFSTQTIKIFIYTQNR